MSEMIERVTSALHDKFGVQCGMPERAMWRPIARAALSASCAVVDHRAPTTNAMTRAWDAAYAEAAKHHGHLESSNIAFIAMMRSALGE